MFSLALNETAAENEDIIMLPLDFLPGSALRARLRHDHPWITTDDFFGFISHGGSRQRGGEGYAALSPRFELDFFPYILLPKQSEV